MRWASAINSSADLDAGVAESAAHVFAQLGAVQPDLVIAFIGSAHAGQSEALPALLAREFEGAVIVGCSASGVLGGGREIEGGPVVALLAAVMPEVRLTARHIEPADIPPVYAPRSAWMRLAGPAPRDTRGLLLLGDPYSCDGEALLQGLDRAYPGVVKVGGFASGAHSAGNASLLNGTRVHHRGCLCLAFEGNVTIEAGVSQGCRPVGEPAFVTAAHDNLIREIDGRSPRDFLAGVYDGLASADRELFANAVSIGVALPGDRSEFGPGDYLVRNVLGLDPQSGALWVGAHIPERAVVQLHIRDAATSALDLERTLARLGRVSSRPHAAGALVFSCVGRGIELYGEPDHDSNLIRRRLGDLPLGGCFCSGEIGPVNDATYVHGYTSVVALFSPRNA
jgi:small ligand-binding sensory domain FIST